ncbi:MAG: YciI family protein [Actinomycetota bacterium]
MSQYLLSTYATEGEVHEPMTPEDMQKAMETMGALEADMRESGTFAFSARLHDADASTVVRPGDGARVVTDGPFAESKEHIAGFYIINADDLDAALAWAGRVVDTINRPIEVRPFVDTHSA